MGAVDASRWARTLGDLDQTAEVAAALGRVLGPGDHIGLTGDLGAGKTTFVQGMARGLGVPPEVRVTSPTFSLIGEVRGGRLLLVHADLYRIERASELEHLGFDEYLAGDAVVAIEWSELYPVLPRDHLRIELRAGAGAGEERRVDAVAGGPRGGRLLAAWRAELGE